MSEINLYETCEHLTLDAGVGLIVGSTGSGKTQLIMDILARGMLHRDGPIWHKIIFMSTTADIQPQYFSGFPERDIFTNPDEFEGVLSGLLDFQKSQKISGVCKPVCVVFDDVIGCMSGKTGQSFGRMFAQFVTKGRLVGVFIFVLTQYLKDHTFSNTTVRSNINFIAGTGLSDANEEKFIEILGEGKEKGKSIVKISSAENYRFVIKDCSIKSKNPGARISLVKVKPENIPKLTIRYRD